ncbi:MAG: hypothetical protein H5T64_12775 [Chloroflexi bacterium]|nr:hypothetical protein [Chloroflexota bacterium]
MTDSRSRYFAVLLIALLALALRWRAVLMLPVDYDEPIYMEAASQYASAIRAGDWPRLIANRHTLEHPPLVKLLYAAGILLRGGGREGLTTARIISLVFGVLQVALLALLNPIAGFFLAIHTMAIKYTSQAYLEALPAFTSLLTIVAYERSAPQKSSLNGWLILSAIALGVTAASKYPYLVVGLVLVPFLAWHNRQRFWNVLLFTGIALLVFLALDIQIWADPVGRLLESILYHPAYSQSAYVVRQHLPWWQPLYYLSHSIPWHPGVFLLSWDTIILGLAMLGIPFLYRRQPIYVLWLLLGVGVLLLWPTRWPQYTLIVGAPLCLSAGTLLMSGVEWLDQHTNVMRTLRTLAPDRPTWLFGSVVALGLLIGFTYFQLQYAQWMKDWKYYVTSNSGLPSNTVRALAVGREGGVWVGTERGAAHFQDGDWVVYSTANSGLVNDNVRAVAMDSAGRVWFGTDGGVSVLDGGEWRSYTTQNSGLIHDHVLCIAPMLPSAQSGQAIGAVWFGTENGVSYFDGQRWKNYTPENSGLAGARVLSIAMDARGRIWFGTWGGLSVLDGEAWTSYTTRNSGLTFDTVSSVVIDSQGRIWCGTLDGVSTFDGQAWRTYNMTNLTLPFNTATVMAMDHRGQIWVGADFPTGPIGGAAMYDGEKWHNYSQYFSQAPLRAIVADGEGIWFGSLLDGIRVYEGFQ